MRRTLLYLMAILYMALGTSLSAQTGNWSSYAADRFEGGNGEEGNPYIIATAAQLAYLAKQVNEGYSYSGVFFEIENSVDKLDLGAHYWEPIGAYETGFMGIFNGNNKTISNLKINNNSGNNIGLFGRVIEATIENLILDNVHIDNATAYSVGALIGDVGFGSKITNCHVTGEGSMVKESIQSITGGLIGLLGAEAEVCLCSNAASVVGYEGKSSYSAIGGLIGESNGTIDRCFNTGGIIGYGSSANTQHIGGLVGRNMGKLTNSYNIGSVTVDANTKVYAGGLCGSSNNEVSYSFAYADITGGTSDESATGGLVGYSDGDNSFISYSLFLSENLTGNDYHFIIGDYWDVATLHNYAWVKDESTTSYGDSFNGFLWSGAMTADPPIKDWSGDNWTIAPDDKIMPKINAEIAQETIKNPLKFIKISNLAGLKAFRDAVNAGSYTEEPVELVADIDFKDEESELDWEPIGTAEHPFKGTFNGNGHTISNLKISDENESSYRGLFGNIDEASIKELILKDVLIESSSFPGIVYTGALVAYSASSTIENCHVLSGTINESAGKNINTGGLIGIFFDGGISLCSNNAKVVADVSNNNSSIGGLIGSLVEGTVNSCFNQGEITTIGATEIQNVGGLVGAAGSYSNILNSYNVGNIVVEAETNVYAGGIAGYTTGMMIAYCYSYADITGGTSAESSTGGIVGFLDNAGIGFSLSLSEKLTGGEGEIGFVCGTLSEKSTITEVYSWVKGMNADLYYDGENTHQKNGALWDGLMNSEPLVYSGDNSEYDWSADNWDIDATDAFMPKIKDLLKGIVQPNVPNPLKASDATYHTITLEVAADIDLYGITAGTHQIEEGGHLHLQFMPEATTATADDILFLVDGVETEFTDFGAGKYFSYILNPVSGDHTILIAMKEYTVTLPEVEGVEINVGAGVHTVPYGEKFTFTLTLDDSIDPADVHVFANGIEVEPDALRATVLSYTIDKVITSIVVVIEGTGGTTGNAHIAEGDITLSIINDQLSIINSGSAVDVAVYTITGQNMVQLRGLRGSKTITLQPGIYLVKAGTQTWKVMVKG